MSDPDFVNWLPGQVAECVSRLEAGRIERGQELSAEDDAAGEAEATKFIETLTVPDCPTRCAQLFPRLWSAQRILDRSLLRPKLRIWEELERREVLQVLLIDIWPKQGRPNWVRERPEGFL